MTQKNTSPGAILFIICLASSIVPFMGSALNLALPYINSDLSLNAVMSGWVPTSYMLSTAILQIPCDRIADMIGRRKVFISGVFIMMLFTILSGLASDGTSLIIYRFLSGIGSAMMFGTSTAILTSSVPVEKRGMALGMTTSVVYFSLAAGPFLGGIITQYLNWNSIFYFTALICLIVVVGSLFLIKDDWKEETKTKFDLIGSILFAAGLLCLIYGFTILPVTLGFIAIGVGVLILILFGLYENKQAYPVFNVRLFLQNRVFRLSSISALINYSATFAISFMLSLYLQYVRGLSPRDAGLILIIQSVIQSIASFKSGKLSDRISPTFLATLGMGIISVGLLGLCFIDETTSYYYLGALLFLLGLGFGTFSSPNANIIMSSVEKQYYGMASATMGTMRLTGQSFSMGIAIMAISLMVGNIQLSSEVSAELVSSMRIAFIVCFILCLIGVYTSSVREGRRKK